METDVDTAAPAILMTGPMAAAVIEQLDACFHVHHLWSADDPEALLRDVGADIRGIATNTLYGKVDASLFDRLPNLEIIANFGVGYDNVDAAGAAARGVMVTNTPGVLDDEVADLTIGLLIATLRQIPQADRFLREGKWLHGAFPLSPTLRGRKVGILGLGNIGKAVARRLEGFGVSIAYCGRSRQDGMPYSYYPTAKALAEACDVMLVIVPGGTQTAGMVNTEVLSALGPNGVLINVSRGSVVDEDALIAALQNRTILSAGLDVFAQEPHVPAALIALPHVVLLPHVGSGSAHTRAAMGQLVVDNLRSWFFDGRPLTPVAECKHLASPENPRSP